MRTTLTIDDDVFDLVKEEMRRSGVSLKEAINLLLRLGLTASQNLPRKPFVVEPLAVGLPHEMSYDKVSELLEMLEGPEHR